jgi:hypothetical protein
MMENCGGEDVVNLLLDKCAAICEICSEDSGTDYVKFNLKKKAYVFVKSASVNLTFIGPCIILVAE